MTPLEYNKKLPNPGDYARSWRTLLTLPPDAEIRVPGFIVGMNGWGQQTSTVAAVLHAVRAALDNRINARAGICPREPREEEYRLRRDANAIKDRLTRRIRIHSFETNTARRRFSHLIAEREDW